MSNYHVQRDSMASGHDGGTYESYLKTNEFLSIICKTAGEAGSRRYQRVILQRKSKRARQ